MHAVYQLLNYYPVMQNAYNSKLSTFKTSRCKGDCWWECLVGFLVLFLFVVVVLFGFFSEIKEKGPLSLLNKVPNGQFSPNSDWPEEKLFATLSSLLLSVEQTEKSLAWL